jgi:AAA+ ATPase superfamily predicted ATPase
LNLRTGKICGVVNKTRDEYSDLGGRAIPVSTIFACFPELKPKKSPENPFTPLSGGIREPDKIFGREKEVKDICEILNSGSSVAIIGKGGIGKTTLLRAVEQQAGNYLRNPRKPLYLNLEGIAGDKDFYYELCSGIGISADYEKPLKGSRLTHELKKHKILLLLDVVDNMREKYFTHQVRSQLRDLANRPDPPLRLVVAANQRLNDLFADSKFDSPFEGICLEINVESWSKEKIKEFIDCRLFDTEITFTEEEISSIIQNNQGYPREIMQACFRLYQTKINP